MKPNSPELSNNLQSGWNGLVPVMYGYYALDPRTINGYYEIDMYLGKDKLVRWVLSVN